MEQNQKVPASLNAPPILVKNNMRPLGQISFQVLGDDDKRVITVNVPRDYNVIDLTHQAPFHNLVNSSSLKRLVDEQKLILLNKTEIDEWIKDKCPEGSGNGGTCPTPELKDQKPIEFDETFSDTASIKGNAEPQATISITVGSDVYFGTAGADGKFSIPAKDLAVGTYTAKAIKTGFKEKLGSLEVKALDAGTALVVNPFEIKGTVTGTAGANAAITVSSMMGSVETTAGPDGAFSVSTATLYLSDTDYEITIVAKEDGKEKQEFKTHGTKLAVPTVTAVNVLTYGDTSAVVKTEPYARVALGSDVLTADSQGNLVFSVEVKADLVFEFGLDSTSIYASGAQTLTPAERQVFLVSSDAQKGDVEHTVRVLGQVSFLPFAQVIATIGSDVKTGTANAQGEVKLTGLDLTDVTSFTVELASTEYKADTVTVQVVSSSVELLDQRAIDVNPVYEDDLEITGSAEAGAIVEFLMGSNVFYAKTSASYLFRLALPEGQTPGPCAINSYKTGYKDATKQFNVLESQTSAPLVINEYIARSIMTGTAQGSALITVTNSVGTVETNASTSGAWSVDTAPLFPSDKNEELTVKSVRKKYKDVEEKITGLRMPAPEITLIDTLYYGDKAVAISSDPKVRVLYGTTELETSLDGKAVYVFAEPLATQIKFTTGNAADSIYVKTDKSFTPTKWETYLIESQTKQTDTQAVVRILSLTTGLPLPSAELSFNGDVHTAVADANGTLTFTGLDLTDHTEAVVKLISDVYVAAPITIKILTEEEAGDKKDQAALTATQVYADDKTLVGTGEPKQA